MCPSAMEGNESLHLLKQVGIIYYINYNYFYSMKTMSLFKSYFFVWQIKWYSKDVVEESDDNGIVQNISPELKQPGVSPSQSSTSLEKVKYFPHNICHEITSPIFNKVFLMHYRTGVEIHQTQVTVVMLKRNSTNALCHSSHAFFSLIRKTGKT